MNSNFHDDPSSKNGQVMFSKCDLHLTLIYEVIQSASSNIVVGLYARFIWLKIVKFLWILSTW